MPQNYAEALKWYRLAADQGNASRSTISASCTPMARACRRITSAHTCGSTCQPRRATNAARNRDNIAKLMTPAQIAEAQKLAREWQPKRP